MGAIFDTSAVAKPSIMDQTQTRLSPTILPRLGRAYISRRKILTFPSTLINARRGIETCQKLDHNRTPPPPSPQLISAWGRLHSGSVFFTVYQGQKGILRTWAPKRHVFSVPLGSKTLYYFPQSQPSLHLSISVFLLPPFPLLAFQRLSALASEALLKAPYNRTPTPLSIQFPVCLEDATAELPLPWMRIVFPGLPWLHGRSEDQAYDQVFPC